MSSGSTELDQQVLAQVLQSCAGPNPVCIQDVLFKTFGKKRVMHAVKNNMKNDPALSRFYAKVYDIVDKAWLEKGVNQEVGPFLNQ